MNSNLTYKEEPETVLSCNNNILVSLNKCTFENNRGEIIVKNILYIDKILLFSNNIIKDFGKWLVDNTGVPLPIIQNKYNSGEISFVFANTDVNIMASNFIFNENNQVIVRTIKNNTEY